MSDSKIHTNTKCRVIQLGEMKFEYKPDDAMIVFRCTLKDGTVIQSNFCGYWKLFKSDPESSYFLVDWKDLANMEKVWANCKDAKEKEEKAIEYLKSVTRFVKFFKKQIYVRLILSELYASDKEPRVFAGEALEIIPLILEQQKTPIEKDDARLCGYRREWSNLWPQAHGSIALSEFLTVLEEFDIDKSLITLIPEPSHQLMRQEYMRVGGHCRLFAHNLTIVCSMHHAVNFAFDSLVMGVNWKYDQCKHHKNCNEKMRKAVMDIFTDFCFLGDDTYLSCIFVVNMIDKTKRVCPETHLVARQVPDYLMNRQPSDEDIHLNHYHTVCKMFHLQRYDVFIPRYPLGYIPVWMHRLFCKLAWVLQFFVGPKEQAMKDIMVEALMFVVPNEHLAAAREFVNSIVKKRVRNQRAIEEAAEEEPVDEATNDAAVKMLAAQLKRNAVIQQKKEDAKQKKKKGKK